MSEVGGESFFPDYSVRDHEIVDYQFYQLESHPGLPLRGPRPAEDALAKGNYFSVIGGAQAVGVFVEKPYATLLAEQIGCPVLNLALGGAGPEFYARETALLEKVNAGRFLVLQVMTARSSANSRLRPIGVELVEDRITGERETTVTAWERLLQTDRPNIERYVRESVASWRQAYRELIGQITVPIILFDFSSKPASEAVNYAARNRDELMGSFPQFVDRESILELSSYCTFYVACRSRRNIGHELRSRFSGEPVQVDFGAMHPTLPRQLHGTNTYYPSPEMHEDACAALLQCVARHRARLGLRNDGGAPVAPSW